MRALLSSSAVILFCSLIGCSGGNAKPPAGPAATSAALTVAPNPAIAGTAVTLTAAITSTTGTPGGTVSFLDGKTSLGTGTLANGSVTLTTSSLAAGLHSLTAIYLASTSFAASSSPAVSLPVNPAPTANGTLSFTTAHQTMVGFGGSEAFYASYLDAHPNETQIMNALYDPVNGLGITYLRLQNNYYNYNGTNPGSFDTDDSKILAASTTALGSKPTVLMTAWTPPASLKSNGSVNGCTTATNGTCTAGFGTLAQVNGAFNYAGYGQFWLASLQAYAQQGVVPDYVSIQNEPDFPPPYVGCVFNGTEAPARLFQTTQSYASYGKAFDATYQAIHASGALTTVPEMIGPDAFSLYNVPSLLQEVPANELVAIGHHLYKRFFVWWRPVRAGYAHGGAVEHVSHDAEVRNRILPDSRLSERNGHSQSADGGERFGVPLLGADVAQHCYQRDGHRPAGSAVP